jgi:hypothetical protein
LWDSLKMRESLDCGAEVGLSLCVGMDHLPGRRTQHEN